MYCLLKWIKFLVKKTKHQKNTGKLEKILEKSGNFVILEKWEPCCDNNGQLLIGKTDDFKLPGYCRLLSAKSCLAYIMKPERPEPN